VRQENGRTEVDLVGLEGRLELAWQPLPPQSTSAPVFEVTTHVAVTLVENESTTIEATQRIQTPAQQVGIEQFQVRLPEGTELLRLESPDVLTSDAVPDSPGVYQVRLRRPVTGGLELKYTLRAPPPQAGESFTLDGFDVQSASNCEVCGTWQPGSLYIASIFRNFLPTCGLARRAWDIDSSAGCNCPYGLNGSHPWRVLNRYTACYAGPASWNWSASSVCRSAGGLSTES
jgi:hypothetical protein